MLEKAQFSRSVRKKPIENLFTATTFKYLTDFSFKLVVGRNSEKTPCEKERFQTH